MENHKEKHLAAATELRRTAKGQAHAKTAEVHPPPNKSKEATQRFIHELEAHQIELEMQNAELLHARDELEVSRKKYAELYDFAPVGYFTFDAAGVIREVNLTGADLLGIEREQLSNTPFYRFIADAEGRETFSNHLTLVVQRQVMLRCEIRLVKKDGSAVHGQLQSIAIMTDDKVDCIHTAIIDGTVRIQLSQELKKAHDNLELTVQEGVLRSTHSRK